MVKNIKSNKQENFNNKKIINNLDDNKEKEKKQKKYSLKNIFQTMTFMCAIGFIIYGLYINFNDYTKKEPEIENKISLEQVKNVYNYITLNDYDLPFYSLNKITIGTINKDFLFASLFFSNKCEEENYPCTIGQISDSDALKKLELKYGIKELNLNNYSYKNISCIKEDLYNCTKTDEFNNNFKILNKFINYEEKDGTLIIYDKYLKYDMTTLNCFIDNDMSVSCNNSEEFVNDLNNLNSDNLLEKYGKEYIHIYIKENDKIYWYSTEPKI